MSDVLIKAYHGGLGDCLQFSTLPEQFSKQQGRDTYVLDESNFRNKSSSIAFSFGPTALQLNGEYFFFEEGSTTVNTEEREEFVTSLNSRINQYWSASVSTHRDLSQDGGSLLHSLRARYSDECFVFESVAERSFTRDADIQPESRILFRLIFKNLGQVESNAG